ncbi:MAG TPA: hypothetical protein VN946_21025 [Terriglobales bacterium]|nr:hypothetical protein [Terriglobales bacterium]
MSQKASTGAYRSHLIMKLGSKLAAPSGAKAGTEKKPFIAAVEPLCHPKSQDKGEFFRKLRSRALPKIDFI